MKIIPLTLLSMSTLLTACAGDPAPQPDTAGTAYVFIAKGSIQCESTGQTRAQSAQPLVDAGIDVVSSRCAYDNSFSTIALCGAGTNEMIIHEIPQASLVDAENLGYASTQTLKGEHTVFTCD
jgi:hypothetical protein